MMLILLFIANARNLDLLVPVSSPTFPKTSLLSKIPSRLVRSDIMSILVRAVLGIICLGGVLCYIGYREYLVSKDTSEEPQPVHLVQLEHGMEPPNNHIKIGDHFAVYDGLVYSYSQGRYDSGEPDADTRVDYVYYPIVSPAHPFMKSISRLQYLDAEAFEEEAENLTLDNFRVIVRSSRFDTVGDFPLEALAYEDSVSGLVVNQIRSLDRQERNLLRESYPELNFDELIILAEGRKPSSPSQSFAMIGGGGVLVLFGLGLGMFVYRR
jgi:hypothetical protein